MMCKIFCINLLKELHLKYLNNKMAEDNKNNFGQALEQLRKVFQDWENEFQSKVDTTWDLLDKDTQLLLFCAVVKKLVQGELVDKGSYRYILYDVFGFGPESYVSAQSSGYIELHNSIYERNELKEKLTSFATENNISPEILEKLLKSFHLSF